MPAASTALPHPPNTSQNVPMNSAASLRDISMLKSSPCDPFLESLRRGKATPAGESVSVARLPFFRQRDVAGRGFHALDPGRDGRIFRQFEAAFFGRVRVTEQRDVGDGVGVAR